jgi:epoxyqueuosine reductase
MIGISKWRVQGMRDPLMHLVMHDLGLESAPLYDNQRALKTASKNRIEECGKHRDGPVSDRQVPVDDPHAMAERIKGMARDLGADMVGIAKLTPIMINIGELLPHDTVICMGFHEDYAAVTEGADAVEDQASIAYQQCAENATKLAEEVRAMGWPALAHHNGGCDIMAIPALYAAGFGELGKHGSLINPEFGASFRPSVVTTTMPLAVDEPLIFGVQDYCENCNLCTNNCPGEAVATAEPKITEGVKRWIIATDKCYPYSRFKPEYCHICVDVCPYIHKENGDADRRGIYKQYMKARKQAGWRAAKGQVAASAAE